MLFSYKYTVCHYYLNAYVEKVVKWLPCPAGRQEKIWFSEESFEAPNPPTGGGKQNSQGSSLISVPCPQGVSSFLWEPGSRAVGWSWPWCPAPPVHCALWRHPWGIQCQSSTSHQHWEHFTGKAVTFGEESQISSRPLENAGKLHLEMGFPPGLSHHPQGWRCWEQGDSAPHSPGRIPLVRLMRCWGTVLSFLPIKIILCCAGSR